MREFETRIEMAGREYPALISYEPDPGDGWPIIEAVEMGRVIERYEEGKGLVKDRISLDITSMLDEGQISALEEEIDCALKAEAEAMDADRSWWHRVLNMAA